MKNEKLPTIIMFAMNTGNIASELSTIKKLFPNNGIAPLQGMYMGTREDSWLLVLNFGNEAAELETLLDLAKAHNQESILISDQDRSTKLIYVNSQQSQDIGTLQAATPFEALQNQNYTYAPHNNTYYITR